MPRIIRKVRFLILSCITKIKELTLQILFFVMSYLHSKDLNAITNNTKNLKGSDILLFCTLRNEAPRIPYFLNYYRKLGVNHFFFVDNGSTDNFFELVKNNPDVSIWHTNASYKKSAFGMHWLNFLLRKYGKKKWCLVCDPDEFLIFPYCDKRNLAELTEFLDSENKRSFFSILLDMYSDKSITDTYYSAGQNPLDVAPFFDKSGFTQTPSPSKETWIQGGVRRRVFFAEFPHRSPALNKLPLIKWHWSYSYISSMHAAIPFFLNEAHCKTHLSPTGCILHFKFLAFLKEKADEEIYRKEHFDASFEYLKYKVEIEQGTDNLYCDELSTKFTDWQQLNHLGLMNTGQWF